MNDLAVLSNLTCNNLNEQFQEIARFLMGNYVIKKGNKEYAIVEIEFYYYSPDHKDFITYPRKTEAGRWFFHQSGVDLTFKSRGIEYTKEGNKKVTFKLTDNPAFGGILIRGIYDMAGDEYIFGPLKCVNLLWDEFDAFDGNKQEYPILDKVEVTLPVNLYACKRHINIKDEDKLRIKIIEWAKRLGLTLNDDDIKNYIENLFVSPYRFINLRNGEKPWSCLEIPSAARPAENETEKIDKSLPI